MNMFVPFGGLALGGALGYAFGALQNAALLRNKQREKEGRLKSGWTIMPGSAGRVAMLLLALAALQIVFPLFFAETTAQWMVSLGVVLGYGWTLVQQFRHYDLYRG